MTTQHHHAKGKRKEVLERNRKSLIAFQLHHAAIESVQRANAASAPSSAPAAVIADEVIWSAKLDIVRNRVNGSRRMATERWNRFAGTSGGGAKGL